jgi:hypothetical protein
MTLTKASLNIQLHIDKNYNADFISYCTMLHLFDDLWLDKIIPKNNDGRQSHIWKSRE